jgi:predicted DsbA family dithiol-disulfide isomerase
MDSLRLLQWSAQFESKQELLADCLSEMHFEKRRCVADHIVLLSACSSVGLCTADAERVLNSSLYREEVELHIDGAQAQGHCSHLFRQSFTILPSGNHSIPVLTFSSQGKQISIDGARSPDEYASVLRNFKKMVSGSLTA